MDTKKKQRQLKKQIRKSIRNSIWKTHIGSPSDVLYDYLLKITKLEVFNLISTFSRIFLFAVGILDLFERHYILGCFLIIYSILLTIIDLVFFIYFKKQEAFDFDSAFDGIKKEIFLSWMIDEFENDNTEIIIKEKEDD